MDIWGSWKVWAGSATVFLCGACGGVGAEPDLDSLRQATQCGSLRDVTPVEQYQGSTGHIIRERVDTRQTAVGLIDDQQHPACSGVLVSRNLFLTAGNCNVVVGTPVHFTGARCKIAFWDRRTDQTEIHVNCFDSAGAPTDSLFSLSYLTANPE